jgi:putative transposase
VIGQCQPRHRHQEFLNFLDRIDQSVDADLAIHLVLDNYGTHKHPEVKKWLAARPRYQVHFTPTSSSWLNQIERVAYFYFRLRSPLPALSPDAFS